VAVEDSELEPGPSGAETMAHELREIADFIETCPEIVVPGDLAATIVAASEAIDALDMIEFEANEEP
jgi:hypothetical protein